jgi:hypothetical protein
MPTNYNHGPTALFDCIDAESSCLTGLEKEGNVLVFVPIDYVNSGRLFASGPNGEETIALRKGPDSANHKRRWGRIFDNKVKSSIC